MSNNDYESNKIPPWERFTLTIPEAAEYYHIGEKRLYSMASNNPNAEYLVFVGNKILFKRKLFEDYLNDASCI